MEGWVYNDHYSKRKVPDTPKDKIIKRKKVGTQLKTTNTNTTDMANEERANRLKRMNEAKNMTKDAHTEGGELQPEAVERNKSDATISAMQGICEIFGVNEGKECMDDGNP